MENGKTLKYKARLLWADVTSKSGLEIQMFASKQIPCKGRTFGLVDAKECKEIATFLREWAEALESEE